jgi:hypothetical protein
MIDPRPIETRGLETRSVAIAMNERFCSAINASRIDCGGGVAQFMFPDDGSRAVATMINNNH